MTNSLRNPLAASVAAAARQLFEAGIVHAATGRPSSTVTAANRSSDEVVERITLEAALDAGVGAISLRFGKNANAMPRKANLAFVDGDKRLVVRNCVLWSDDAGPVLLVPFDARHDFHFGIGSNGLERRAGRPAAMLGKGMSRAADRLGKATQALRRKDLGPTFTVLTDTEAAA